MADELFSLIYNKALDLISRREHSKKELKDKLLKRFEQSDQINQVIEKLESNNLIDNYRFAEMYVMSRKRKGFGPKKIAYELLTKGVCESTAQEIIDNQGEWTDLARIVFMKKFKNGPSEELKEKIKQKSFLQNRGFSFKEIESVFLNDML